MKENEISEIVLELRLWRFLKRNVEREKNDKPPYGLGDVSASVLALIEATEKLKLSLNQKQLAQKIHSSAQSVSPILQDLRDKGLCKILGKPNEHKKGHCYRITPEGIQALRQWIRWKIGEPELAKFPFADLKDQLRFLMQELEQAVRC